MEDYLTFCTNNNVRALAVLTRHAPVLYSYRSRHRCQTLRQQVQGSHHTQYTISPISPSTHTSVAPEDSPETRHHALEKKSILQYHRKAGSDASHPGMLHHHHHHHHNINTRHAKYTAAPSGRRGSTLSQDGRTLPILVCCSTTTAVRINTRHTTHHTRCARWSGSVSGKQQQPQRRGTCIVRYRTIPLLCVSSEHKLSYQHTVVPHLLH